MKRAPTLEEVVKLQAEIIDTILGHPVLGMTPGNNFYFQLAPTGYQSLRDWAEYRMTGEIEVPA